MENNTFEEGRVILIDKPLRWTSFDVIKKVRNVIRVKKTGHAGTLDPLATGLLILCTGKFTRRINEFMGQEKEYTGTFTLGATTPTYDLESEPENFRSLNGITLEALHNTAASFTGEINQIPPIYSAVKQQGKPVYLKARKGQEVILEPRKVTIHSFVIEQYQEPVVTFRVICSTGTYIRSLANDFGRALGTGAYLSALRRTRIGLLRVEEAVQIDDFVKQHDKRLQDRT